MSRFSCWQASKWTCQGDSIRLKFKRDTWRQNLSAYMLLQALKPSRIIPAVDVMGQRKQDTKVGIPGLLQNQKAGREGT